MGAEAGSLSSDRSGLIWVYCKTASAMGVAARPSSPLPLLFYTEWDSWFASELKETKDISVCPLLLCFYFSLLWIISSVKEDQNSSLLFLQVLLWLCSSSTAEGHVKCCLTRQKSELFIYSLSSSTAVHCCPYWCDLCQAFHVCFDMYFSNCIIKSTACLLHGLLSVILIIWATILFYYCEYILF